ncbi:hypothetical protein JMC51_004318 [Vibrio parahaemolyticus]|nr:hypothetical protein [Vibrio parahaemolyticus]EHA6976199.1 hypothetical protein [Vibrio parahaemolyticus]HAS6299742.1 hypothetical protein [Vibrio vulnificus]HDY7571843.1 hypothetical protein [Vibrio vulnificus]
MITKSRFLQSLSNPEKKFITIKYSEVHTESLNVRLKNLSETIKSELISKFPEAKVDGDVMKINPDQAIEFHKWRMKVEERSDSDIKYFLEEHAKTIEKKMKLEAAKAAEEEAKSIISSIINFDATMDAAQLIIMRHQQKFVLASEKQELENARLVIVDAVESLANKGLASEGLNALKIARPQYKEAAKIKQSDILKLSKI